MLTAEVMERLVGAYGQSRKVQLKQKSAQQQSQRLAEIRTEQRRLKSLEQQRSKQQKSSASVAPGRQEAKVKTRLTRLIDIRAGYYEAELLKELKIRRETLDEDVEREDVVPMYKDYQPGHLPRVSPPRQSLRAPLPPKTLSRSTAEPLGKEEWREEAQQAKLEKYIQQLDAKLARLGHASSGVQAPRKLLRARF